MSTIRYISLTDQLYAALDALILDCFPDSYSDQIRAEDFASLYELFPMGTVVALDGDRVVGVGVGIFVDLDFEQMPPTEDDLLFGANHDEHDNLVWLHDPAGDYYWGADIAVHPDYRGRGIARQIYNWRKRVVVENNRKGFAASAVLPGFAQHRDNLTIHEYVAKVVAKELFDPTLSVQLRNGFRVLKLLPNYFYFPRSDHWAALIFWENPHYSDARRGADS